LAIDPAGWRAAGMLYYGYNFYLRRKFGGRVQKVSIDAGFTCPNVDGTVAIGGCNFCDNRSFSPARRSARAPITKQIDQGIHWLRQRYDCDQFLAYFQPATNTYAPVERLRRVYEEALAHPLIKGLVIGTRPDCVPNDVLDFIEELGRKTYVSLEYGMQTMHDRSLDWMNRGHHHASFIDAMERSRGRGIEICAHVILGIPGESREDMLATAEELARLEIDAVKIHNLYAVRKTPLGDQYERGEIRLMDFDEYIEILVDVLERLPPTTIVERVSGDAPDDYFLGPAWCVERKPAVRLAMEAEFRRRGTVQGARFRGAASDSTPKFQ
jgi:radical SAM protein (TIGR01212 family)